MFKCEKVEVTTEFLIWCVPRMLLHTTYAIFSDVSLNVSADKHRGVRDWLLGSFAYCIGCCISYLATINQGRREYASNYTCREQSTPTYDQCHKFAGVLYVSALRCTLHNI